MGSFSNPWNLCAIIFFLCCTLCRDDWLNRLIDICRILYEASKKNTPLIYPMFWVERVIQSMIVFLSWVVLQIRTHICGLFTFSLSLETLIFASVLFQDKFSSSSFGLKHLKSLDCVIKCVCVMKMIILITFHKKEPSWACYS